MLRSRRLPLRAFHLCLFKNLVFYVQVNKYEKEFKSFLLNAYFICSTFIILGSHIPSPRVFREKETAASGGAGAGGHGDGAGGARGVGGYRQRGGLRHRAHQRPGGGQD